LAIPKKIVTPWPQRVESGSGGTPKQLSMSYQLFITQTSPSSIGFILPQNRRL
jgi:hypothetical protein